MVREAEMDAKKDQERKALIDAKNTADTTAYSVGKSLNEYKDKIPAEVASEIEAAVADSKKASGGDSVEEIQSKIDAANKTISKIGEHMSGGGSAGGSSSSGGLQGGYQPPETEYEEVNK
ncbi:Adenosinetriphosphatase [Heracleum sosnowskyi]|uniref:Adenosinetriphosphatase n=1 Tax=Heracleum sosnowskyi TaxID=360622 RepID=A0AAD8JFH3_9APIA|nr:Adenosinetriphosphatase [Heracleum sosnowskyi]